MSELVTFLREEVAAQHYARVLRQRCFTHWKFAQSKYHPMPLSRGTLAAAAFRWLLTSFGDDALAAGGLGQGGLGQGIAAKNLFPFYAAVEQGGAEGGAFFLSRLRSYMTDRLSLPPQNLPLLAHAVALFDAHQLTQCFSKWARFQRRCRQLDVFCFEQRARRLLRLWAGRAGKSALHRRRVQLLRRRVAQRSARHWLSLWQALFRAVRFRRGVRAPRSKGQALLALRRLLTGRRLARLCLTSATRFRHGRGLRLATLRLQQRLCGVRMGEADFARALRRPQLLHAWLVHVVRGWEGSQRAMCETVRRCQWIRMHRFTARLATSASFAHSGARGGNGWGSGGRDGGRGGADSRSARSRRYDSCDSDDPDDEGGGQRHRDEFSTPQRQRKERWVGQGSGSDMGNTGPPLSLSLLSPDDLSAARRAPHSHIDSHTDSHIDSHISGGHSGNQSPSRGRGSAPSAAEAAAAQDGDAAAVAAVALTLLSRLQASLGSRQSQGALLQCAATFRRLRCLLRAVRRWQYRVPQVQLDDPDAIALCFPATAQGAQQLRTLTLQMACGRGGDSEGGQGRGRQGRGLAHLYFAAFKRQHRAWGRWRDRSKNNRVATAAGLQLGGRTVALRQTFAFGAWLVTTGRFQQLRRTANRVLCNRFGKELWTAFFAWRHHFERVLLVRCNDRDLLRLKQEEIERFCEGRELRDSRSSQAVALRDWALHVRGLRRLRLIAGLWHATAGKRHLMAAWHTWRLLLGLDLIATCLKKIFRGFRVRRRLQPSARRVAYLQVFARNMPLYTAFRRLAMKRCVFGVLVRHHLQRHLLSTATMRVFLLRRAIRRLQRGALRSHTQRRDMRSARAQRVVLALTAAVRVLGRRHRRLRFLARVRQVARLQVYRRMVRLLHASCLIRRQKRLHHRHYRRQALLYTLRYMHAWHLRQQTRLSFRRRCVHFLMRRGVRRLRHWARVHVRLRRWALTRAHRGARGVLRRWAASARHKRGQAGMADKLYRMRRFRLWFRWWLRESLRHSKLMRRLRQDRGGVGGDGTVLFYMAQRGGRHFSIVRGVISSRVRWHLRKFSKFTSFRRRGRALAGYLMQRWVTLRLSRAFQRLHLFWHRGRGRGRRRGGLGRRLGQGGRGLSDPWGGPHSLHSLHSHTFPQARRREAGPPHAHGSHSTYGTWSGYDAPHQHGGGGNDANSRRYRNHGLVGVRHQVARSSPSTRQEVLQRLHENVTHLPEQNQLRRGFAGWQDFCRYNARNGRALQRLGAEYWRRVARSALQRMHSLLLRRRTRKALVQRLHRSQGSQAMRMFLQRTHLGARRRLRLFRALVLHVSSRDRRAKKALFRRLYSACFFNRYALRLRCTAKLRAAVRGAVRRLRFVAWHHLRSPAALAIRRMDLQRQRHALGRLRGLLEKGSYRAGIYKACARHRCVMSALLVLRQWHRLVRLRQRVQRCVRRLAIRPPLKLWYQLTFDIVRERSIVTHSLRSIHGRAKREILRRWGAWASRTSRLRTQAEMLQGRVRLGCKREALYAWLRAIDQQVCMGKFQRVAQLARRSAVQACFALWHRSALLSELSTWRSGRTALRNWVVSAYWTQRRRIALRRAEAFCCTYPMQVALFVWYRGVRAVVRRRGRAYNAHRLRTLKAYLLHFRRWKRRMHIACWVGRLRLRSCGAFTAHRAMLKWWT
ncbi:hypothetical protein B484DRAFT_420758 [Ochromonadaceae sp. CCMP2298]|nr:hypothetical protein B484DRAFT_420758 [Ochromonadaceae sp. CCMP2298]